MTLLLVCVLLILLEQRINEALYEWHWYRRTPTYIAVLTAWRKRRQKREQKRKQKR